ncbi:YdcF family protein [Evansella tamaricis]|uniref:YdcF family protein n=1 Tax=Evansella tamaricis TaxID=2069301 RepID=A0ABS6JGF6_9BACI|nr:YdcF family protein [Evansella tamaricis]MBU9711530.1 YdcF family protein [Evansella tamaricis]
MEKRSEKKSFIVKVFIILFFFSVVIGFLFWKAGTFLVIHNSPIPSDAVIVLSGYDNRMETGVSLITAGYGEHLILSDSNFLDVDIAIDAGIPEENIIYETLADSTYENAVFTKEIMLNLEFNSAIVVSSEFHMRRSKFIFEKVFQGTNMELTYVSAQNSFFNANQWWENEFSRTIVFQEYIKLIGYWLKY